MKFYILAENDYEAKTIAGYQSFGYYTLDEAELDKFGSEKIYEVVITPLRKKLED